MEGVHLSGGDVVNDEECGHVGLVRGAGGERWGGGKGALYTFCCFAVSLIVFFKKLPLKAAVTLVT